MNFPRDRLGNKNINIIGGQHIIHIVNHHCTENHGGLIKKNPHLKTKSKKKIQKVKGIKIMFDIYEENK